MAVDKHRPLPYAYCNKTTEDAMKNRLDSVKLAMLSVQRYPWEQGVCMQAIYESGDITTAIAMAHDAVLRQQKDGRLAVINDNIAVTDPASSGIMVRKAYEITGDAFYKEAADRMLYYLLHIAPKTRKHILCHNEVSLHEGFSPNQIWVDSIYMAPPFLAYMGYPGEAMTQIEGMVSYLKDPETGLLNHIYDAGSGRFVREKLWATGNGWALLGIASVIDIANDTLDTEPMQLLFRNILDAMLRYQLPDGRFHDILNEEDSFVDGASAMMMAAAVYRGCHSGWLSKDYLPYADKVVATMDQYVDDYGIIHEVCGCPHFLSVGTSAESMAAYIMMHSWKKADALSMDE